MRILPFRRKRLTLLTSTAAALLLAAACGVDDSRVMHMTDLAGTAGDATAGSSMMTNAGVNAGGEGGAGGESMMSAGKAGMSGGGMGGKAGSGGMGGKGGSGGMSLCGNGKIDRGEECDDGNQVSGDGCSAQCQASCEKCEIALKDDPLAPSLLAGDLYSECYAATDRAVGGPADGAPRAALCAAVVDCVRRTGCAVFSGSWIDGYNTIGDASLAPCWCTDVTTDGGLPQAAPTCYSDATLSPGPCYPDFQNGAEADGPDGIGTAIIDSGLALGRAGRLLRQSDSLFCAKSCWPDPTAQGGMGGMSGGGMGGTAGMSGGGMGGTAGVSGGGMGGTAGVGGTAGNAGSGGKAGSGGAGGNGGSGGGSTCGNGKIDDKEECEPPNTATCSDDCQRVMDDGCESCEETELDGACAAMPGCLAYDGADRATCFDVMECVRSSNCADGTTQSGGSLTKCFCGNLSTANCIAAPSSGAGAPAGACAAIIRQGFSVNGPATNSEVMTHFIDGENYSPASNALERLNCDWVMVGVNCHALCGY
jgi:cysteine-rich repeat protein